MWLLDVNMPRQLKGLLAELHISAETATERGWGTLVNGELLQATVNSGFSCLLTRDRLFGEAAAKDLKDYPLFFIVIITLPQVRASQFLSSFREAWGKKCFAWHPRTCPLTASIPSIRSDISRGTVCRDGTCIWRVMSFGYSLQPHTLDLQNAAPQGNGA